ncbi:hypothetical protein AB7M35_001797 [Amorphus suaedae]
MSEALIGLIGVVVGSVIAISKDVWTSWLQRRREGSYSAIRLICILEDYASDCLDVVYDDGTAQGRPAGCTEHGEEYHEEQVSTPQPPAFPDDIAWRSLPEELMHRTLALPNKAKSTDRHISACSEHADPPDYDDFFKPRREGYARLGLDALELANDLRRNFGISAKSHTPLNSDWDPIWYLEKKISAFENGDY